MIGFAMVPITVLPTLVVLESSGSFKMISMSVPRGITPVVACDAVDGCGADVVEPDVVGVIGVSDINVLLETDARSRFGSVLAKAPPGGMSVELLAVVIGVLAESLDDLVELLDGELVKVLDVEPDDVLATVVVVDGELVELLNDELLGALDEVELLKEELLGVLDEVEVLNDEALGMRGEVEVLNDEALGMRGEVELLNDEALGMRGEVELLNEEPLGMRDEVELLNEELLGELDEVEVVDGELLEVLKGGLEEVTEVLGQDVSLPEPNLLPYDEPEDCVRTGAGGELSGSRIPLTVSGSGFGDVGTTLKISSFPLHIPFTAGACAAA